MTFPVFASLTTISSPLWDNAYSQLNLQSLYPGSVSGTNAITFTPSTNAPAISAYANYQSFFGIVAVTNTGAVTFQSGSLPALSVYKDTAAGPAVLTGGEQFAGNRCIWTYDSALNSGAGGFHLDTGPADVAGAYLPLSGGTLTGVLVGTTVSAAALTVSGLFTGASITASGNASVASLNVGGLASVGKAQVGGGTSITRILSTIASITWTSITPGATQDQTIALGGCLVNDLVLIGPPAAVSTGIVFSGYVSVAGVVAVRAGNLTSATTITPQAGSYQVGVMGTT